MRESYKAESAYDHRYQLVLVRFMTTLRVYHVVSLDAQFQHVLWKTRWVHHDRVG